MKVMKVMKRPATKLIKRPATKVILPAPEWVEDVDGAALPNWSEHWVKVLRGSLDGLVVSRTLTSGTTINVWSDCGGMCTEMFALADIKAAIASEYAVNVTAKLHCFCDTDKHCRQLAIANHAPTHVSDDIYSRNFDDGTYECSLCADSHYMPRTGLDVYACCFPCGPWSKAGLGLGFNDDDGQVCWQAIASIKYMQPSLYLMENVVSIGDKNPLGPSDVDVIKAHMVEHLPGYAHIVVTGVDPTMNGFPVHRNRIFLIGGRVEVIASKTYFIGIRCCRN
jgi:site-specific DNA-cytosine methylase